MRLILPLAGLLALMIVAHPARADDADFVKKAAVGGMAEVAAGELAKQKAQSPEKKQFGETMVADHTKTNNELKAIAEKKNMTVPAKLDSAHEKAIASLGKKDGEDFDKAFKKQMVGDHEKTIKLFEKQSKDGKDPELKDFATRTLPALKHHLEMAKALK